MGGGLIGSVLVLHARHALLGARRRRRWRRWSRPPALIGSPSPGMLGSRSGCVGVEVVVVVGGGTSRLGALFLSLHLGVPLTAGAPPPVTAAAGGHGGEGGDGGGPAFRTFFHTSNSQPFWVTFVFIYLMSKFFFLMFPF